MCSAIMDIIVCQKVKNTEKSPSPFINVDTIIVLFSSAYSYFFCYNIDKGGRRDILGLFKIFAATFPYVVLIILFFVGVTLPGAEIGLKALFNPKVKSSSCSITISNFRI